MKIDILGTTYNLVEDNTTFLVDANLDGVCKEYDKEIRVRKLDGFLGNSDSQKSKDNRRKEVLRHEIIHAFFSEAGLDDYSANEQLVNWLAIQIPKMLKTFKKAGAI